jgi:hypothetical protein
MIYNQKIATAFGTPLRKGLLVGATSVVAAGALLGVGAAGASASIVPAASVSSHGSASTHGSNRATSVIEQLRAAFFSGSIDGSKAQALASRIVADPAIYSALPASLQSDLTALKAAPSSDAVAQAGHIESTALAGGYGDQVKSLAVSLQDTARYPVSHKLVRQIRNDVAHGKTEAATATAIAKSVSEDPKLLATLPSNLRSDVTTLQNASPSDAAAQVATIEATAVSGDYGPQIQQLSQTLASLTASASK